MISFVILAVSLTIIGVATGALIVSELRYAGASDEVSVFFPLLVGVLGSAIVCFAISAVVFIGAMIIGGEERYNWESEPVTYDVVQVASEKKGYVLWYDEDGDGSAEKHKISTSEIKIVEGDKPEVTLTNRVNIDTGFHRVEAVLALPSSYSFVSSEEEDDD